MDRFPPVVKSQTAMTSITRKLKTYLPTTVSASHLVEDVFGVDLLLAIGQF